MTNPSSQLPTASASLQNRFPLPNSQDSALGWPTGLTRTPEFVVIGGGIVGAATALELGRRGHETLLLERNEAAGMGCSYGNAGWMTPCFALPLPMPGMMFKALGWLLDPSSPLYIQPRLSPALFSWLLRFTLSMRESKAQAATAALVRLSQRSLERYSDLSTRHGFGFEKKGLLMVSETDSGMASIQDELRRVSLHGVRGELLGPDDVEKLEGGLKRGMIKGGVYFQDEAHAEPLDTVAALLTEAVSSGVKVVPRAEVFDWEESGSQGVALWTTRGRIVAKNVIFCTGPQSPSLARRLGFGVPILSGKGYAITLPKLRRQPQIPLMILDRKIAVTPRANSLRVAGTLELVDENHGITPHRVHKILEGARRLLEIPEGSEEDPLELLELWRGLRPCTPDGVPMIGKIDSMNHVYLNVGHQMLGLQSAPGCAELLAQLIFGEKPQVDPRLFSPGRF
jgi:D-amino-acid dehydrogenase